MNQVKFISAIDDKRGIAKAQKLPWRLPTDQKFFRSALASAPGLMGWNTFASNGYKPYEKSPKTFLITHRDGVYPGVEVIHDLPRFMELLAHDLWVIGGGEVFSQLLPYATHLYLTRVSGDFDCDVFFPEFEGMFELAESKPPRKENSVEFMFQTWTKSGQP